jgi:outer membrane protein assembly factor BamB
LCRAMSWQTNNNRKGRSVRAGGIIGAALGLSLLVACSDNEVLLQGPRLDIRDGFAGAQETEVNQALPIRLTPASINTEWTHRGGGPAHRIAHPALGEALALQFAVKIGEGNDSGARITADPVVSNGMIYTVDAYARVTAVSISGETLWTRDLAPRTDNASSASGGSLAVSGGRLFVGTGYGRLTALDAASGNKLWSQDLDAPGTAAPTVAGKLVYIVARDSRAWALDVETGRIAWTADGTAPTSNFGGGAGPAIGNELAVFPFPSGEVLAAFPRGGLTRWSTVIAGQRLGHVAASVSDISADPVIDGNRVYVGNVSGRTVALDLATGERLWTLNDGATGPVWPVGGSIFLLNDLNELIRADAASGEVIWRVALPRFVSDRPKRQRDIHALYGPILAGGRLIVASSDETLREFDPFSGALLRTSDLPGGAASSPIVAGGTLYVVSTKGQLLAFR